MIKPEPHPSEADEPVKEIVVPFAIAVGTLETK